MLYQMENRDMNIFGKKLGGGMSRHLVLLLECKDLYHTSLEALTDIIFTDIFEWTSTSQEVKIDISL